MAETIIAAHFTDEAPSAGQTQVLIHADNLPKGEAYTLPAATASALGGVKQAAALTKVSTADAAAAIGDAPTKAEFDAVVTLLNACKAALNANVDKTKAAGQSA